MFGTQCEWCPPSNSCFNSTLNPTGCLPNCAADSCTPSTVCGELLSCGDCTANPLCGWCSSTQTCLRGGPSGDCGLECTASPWSYGNCTANCPFAESCSNCTTDGCIWCEDTSSCFAHGHNTAPCVCASPVCVDCSAATDCVSCTANPLCGFCLETGLCLPAASPESPCASGTCADPARNWLTGSCAANCSAFSDSCTDCVSQAASGCRYCAADDQCLGPGEYDLCSEISCLDDSCPVCATWGTCLECTGDPGCGWCDNAQTCMAGSAEGSCAAGGCPAKQWSYSSCNANCGLFSGSCDACVSAGSGCGYCADAAICESVAVLQNSTCACQFEVCPAVDCGVFSGTNCSTCTGASELCGWCPVSKTCSLGTDSGPCQHGVTCAANWAIHSCDALCEAHGSCSTCRADLASNCGWCAGTRPPHSTNPTTLCLGSRPDGSGPQDGAQCERWYPPGASSQPPCADCSLNFDTCASCVADSNCGWCAEQHCQEGNAQGPFDPLAPLCTTWSYGNCNAQCELITTCGTCATTSGCGWCSNPGHISGTCVASAFKSGCYQWNQGPGACAPDCGDYINCGACVANSSCGWCDVSVSSSSAIVGQCVEGTGTGPFGTVTCPEGYTYGPNACELKCVSYPDCGGCLQGHVGCGYCLQNGGECMPGSYNGPSLGSCPQAEWVYEPNHCPSNPCAVKNTSCAACIAADSCGWCAADAECYPGFKSSPLPPYFCSAAAWQYSSCPGPAQTTPHRSGSAGPAPWAVAAITVGVMLVPIAIGVAFAYKKFVLKYRYPPLE